MALAQLVGLSTSVPQRCTVMICINRLSVRFKLGYRDQHPKQAIPKNFLENHRVVMGTDIKPSSCDDQELKAARYFRHVHPEFLPNSMPEQRDPVYEQLERQDMLKRRAKLDIPEFYVGSLMAVTLSDPYAETLESRFVGICIERSGSGLRHNFTLRNVVNGQGIEIMYELYNPTIKNIQVLKLEKRLDENLFYLRDAPNEYSTVPFDLEQTPHPKGAQVPVNTIKVPLNPRPWRERWERHDLKGVKDLEKRVPQRLLVRAKSKVRRKPWEKYDLVKKYRESISVEDEDFAYGHFAKGISCIEKGKLDQRNQKKNESLI